MAQCPEYNYCTLHANIVHTSKLRTYKLNELGVLIVTLQYIVHALHWTVSPINQSCDR